MMVIRSLTRRRVQLFAAQHRAPVTARMFCDSTSAIDKPAAPPTASSQPPPPAPTTSWNTIVVGEIIDLHRHPDAERLNVCQVNVGDPENLLQIICGAPNAVKGARVPVAKISTKLAIKDATSGEVKQVKIKKSKLRGELSQGMICSEAELGLADHSDGILILEDDAPVGSLVQDWSSVASRLLKD